MTSQQRATAKVFRVLRPGGELWKSLATPRQLQGQMEIINAEACLKLQEGQNLFAVALPLQSSNGTNSDNLKS